MSASNLLIPFISVCSSRQSAGVFACAHVAARARGRVCQRQMATRDCVCVLEMSRSHLHWSLCPAEEGGRAPPRAFVACLRPLSFSLFSHICWCYSVFIVLCLICLILSQSLPLSPASQPIVFVCQSSHARAYCSCSPYLSFLLFCLFLSHRHSIPFILTFSAPASSGSILLFSTCGIQKNHPGITGTNRSLTVKAHFLACIWCNDPKSKLLPLLAGQSLK